MVKWSLCDTWVTCITCIMCANICGYTNSIAAKTGTLESCVGVLWQKVGCITCAMWRNTCGVAEPLLQAELLLYTVVYCEVDRLWQWVGCKSCNGHAVTQILLQATHTVRWAFRDSDLAAYSWKTACKLCYLNALSSSIRSCTRCCRLLCRKSSNLSSACRIFAALLVGSSLSSSTFSHNHAT